MAALVSSIVLAAHPVPAPDVPSDSQPVVPVVRVQTVPAPQSVVLVRSLAKAKRQLRSQRREIVGLRRTLLHRPDVSEAIDLACVVYGNCSTLWRRARCESHLYRYAQNVSSGASGLFQFLGSTWRSTPFGSFSVWSPYANALAAGWMMGPAGRGGEWQCR